MKRLLITRPRALADAFGEAVRKAGFEPVFFPVIETGLPAEIELLDKALTEMPTYDWLVLTSVNGVEAVWERMEALGIRRLPDRIKVAAIGPKTAAALKSKGVEADFVPDEYVAEAILPGLGDLKGVRVLLPRADLARPDLPEAIRRGGGFANEVTAYTTLPAKPDPGAINKLRQGVDIVTFTSPSTVQNFDSLVRSEGFDPPELPGNPAYACIGPITARAARELGYPVAVTAGEYTTEGLLEAILAVCDKG